MTPPVPLPGASPPSNVETLERDAPDTVAPRTPTTPPEEPAGRRRARGATLRRVALGAIVPVAAIGCWQMLGVLKIYPPALVPPPLAVLKALGGWAGVVGGPQAHLFYTGNLVSDMTATLIRVLAGFLIASVVGVALGTVIGISRTFEELLSPAFRIIAPVPPITFIPISIVLLGLGDTTNILLTCFGALFPIVAATVTAVSGVHRDLLRAGRMMGRSQFGLVRSVILPAALPGITGSLRIGLGLAWMMAVTSEMLAVRSGLGYTLWNAYNYLDYPAVYAAMLVTGVCGLATDALLRLATRRALRWHVDTGVRS